MKELTGTTLLTGLLGKPVKHSKSPLMHNKAFELLDLDYRYLCFEVDTDGTVLNPKILRDIGGGCGEEALRIVRLMPKWKPGRFYGKVVKTTFNLPIFFDKKKHCIPLIHYDPIEP